jgi:phage internal scaffolding protein
MKRTNGTKRFQIKFDQDDGRTQQHQKDECDINLIIKKHSPEQIALMASHNEGQYGDATSVDYHAAQNIIANANTMFNELPSEIRNQFDNDPSLFLDFTSNKENEPAMREMGLLSPLPPEPNTAESPVSVSEPVSKADDSASVNASQSTS